MTGTWEQYVGQAVDGIPLRQLLGGGDASAVYLGELAGHPCAVKLLRVEESAAPIPLARWQQASKLSHPNITRIEQWGRARLGGESMVYLVVERAEDTLADLDRPLTPKEAREMLTPAVAALAYVHSKGMAHGYVKPSNVLSANETLKISGDSPLRMGDKPPLPAKASPYDAPESATAGVTAAGDVWSLGVTLVEALTKQLPVREGDSVRLPESLRPDSFREVAAGCLQVDPSRRWTVADLQQWLERGTVPAPKAAKRPYMWLAAAAVAVVVIAAIVLPRLIGPSHSGTSSETGTPSETVAAQTSDATPPPQIQPPASPPPPAQPVAPSSKPAASSKSAPSKPPEPSPKLAASSQPAQTPSVPAPPVNAAPSANTPAAAPDASKQRLAIKITQKPDPPGIAAQPKEVLPPAETTQANSLPTAADVIPSDVLQPVRPDVPPKSRVTIHGKVPIFVRVEADASGAVTDAKIESGASSKYFADMSLKAARQWKFAPGDADRAWVLRFEYTRDAEHSVTMQASRMR